MSSDAESTNARESADTRDKVLAAIRRAATPPTVDEIARQLDLHHNSVRLHAAVLRDAGLITQASRPGTGRGRPQTTYSTSPRGAWTGRRDYRLLASLLLSELHATEGGLTTEVRRVGHAWGRRLAAGASDDAGRSVPKARERVVTVLDELGFEPTTDPRGDDVELRNCPFLELVDPDDGLVCAIHGGMLDGLVDGGEATVDLHPFTSPHACTVRIRAR
ncbi:metalloregulator ArsR/SmtB family transcription factor [Dietzia sp. ANT_WB102]|uniref:helix-turn-helix transcriptional regulator n=1 Tax=Dietzia sp. ANT_WB102 TaxID=2597345 RepID=UPI0011EF3881|nr:helix-turn-helix domain-containing protein [Dietzia sp. ANT_WB102]KAA0917870.1 helix-turn-helix domain-containing protein [Dietzia sp. ANT_WB102]